MALGKDEAGSSNPPSNSAKSPLFTGKAVISFFAFATFAEAKEVAARSAGEIKNLNRASSVAE